MRSRRDRIHLIVLAGAAVAAWGVAAYFSMVRRDVPAPGAVAPTADTVAPTADTAAPTAHTAVPTADTAAPAADTTADTAVPTADTAADTAVPTADTAVPTANVAATAVPTGTASAESTGVTACVTALFPADAFTQRQPDFAFICTDPYPRHGITEVQAQVVLGRGNARSMTEGMREWATLGWYQLAAYSVYRGRCCRAPAKLEWAFDLACPLDEAMTQLERAVAAQDAKEIDNAVERYTQEARCITKLGQASNFGQSALPGAGLNSLQQLLARVK